LISEEGRNDLELGVSDLVLPWHAHQVRCTERLIAEVDVRTWSLTLRYGVMEL
jgi:hypothetical protein